MAEMKKLLNTANIAQVQDNPCSMCFGKNHTNGECIGNCKEVNLRDQVPPYNSWNK